MNKFQKWLVIGSFIVVCAGCASTSYTTYEGSGVQQGTGGGKTVVNGIDIWTDGTPPRKFKIIGMVDDTRGMGLITSATYYPDLADQAKKAGGDAVIVLGTNREASGIDDQGYISHRTMTKAEVIKYVK